MTMGASIEFLPGPLTSDMTRTAAEGALRHHPAIQKGAAYALEQLEGRWVAAVVHEGGPFPPTGGPDETEESPAPQSEGPPGGDESPGDGEDAGGPPKGDGDGDADDKPSHEHGEHGEHGGGELHQLMQMMQQIAEALGLPIGLGESPVPGPDQGPVPPPAGPPHAPMGPGGPSEQHVIHERVTKPGETPPGGTPVGAPAFASVRADHPWAHLAGKVASFEVADQIGDAPLTDIQSELKTLASEIKYRVARFREDRDESGNRMAVAVITSH